MPTDRLVTIKGIPASGQITYRDDHQAYDEKNNALYRIHTADMPRNVTVSMLANGITETVGAYSFDTLEVDGTVKDGYHTVQIQSKFTVSPKFIQPSAARSLLDFHILQIIVDEKYFNGSPSSPQSAAHTPLTLPYTDPPYEGLAVEGTAPAEPFFLSLKRRASEFVYNKSDLTMIDGMGFMASVKFLHGVVHCDVRVGAPGAFDIRPLLMFEIEFSKTNDDTPDIMSSVTQLADPALPFKTGGTAANAFTAWKAKGRANQKFNVKT